MSECFKLITDETNTLFENISHTSLVFCPKHSCVLWKYSRIFSIHNKVSQTKEKNIAISLVEQERFL